MLRNLQMSRESVVTSAQEKEDISPLENGELTTDEKGDLAIMQTNASETQYPPMRRVIVITIAMYLAMFLVALVRPPRACLYMLR